MFNELWLDCLALLWPTACVGCGAPDRDLCRTCMRRTQGGDAHEALSRIPAHGLAIDVPCYVGGEYTGVLREVLVAYKHGGVVSCARPLGHRLAAPLIAAAAEAQTPAAPCIVAVPSRRARVRERGYAHVDALVRIALRSRGISARRVLVPGALTPLCGRTGQVGLDADARERNARRIAAGRRAARLRGREVIIVDDIITTGATLRAAIAVLEGVGVNVVAVVALCATPRRDTREKLVVEGRS